MIHWQPFEDEQIRDGYATGEKVHSIAYRLRRNYGQIADRARQLGLFHKRAVANPADTQLPGALLVDIADRASVVLRCFRDRHMDTLDIARFLRLHESTVVTLLHAAREAERAK